ncbi:Pvc16 family protein [Streptomyces sp. NPDC004667]|uniref:Pvc16 family protein n=1 Tax=Streptomyces sp. NPDC004667 TaxID=3154285 RepID=UPI0033ACF687
MLHAISAALTAHLETAPAGGRRTVTAEAPPPSVTAAPGGAEGGRGLGAHLFHVAALDQGRPGDAAEVRDERGRVVGRRPPVRRYRTRWLLWAWAPTAPERLALLDEALVLLSAGLVLPGEVVGPELAAGGPVQLEAAPPGTTVSELNAVFTSLGVPARPALEAVVTAGLVMPVEPVAGPPADVRVVARPRALRPPAAH